MFQDITLGQYFPGQSIIHRLDPRTKIFAVLALLILIFSAEAPTEYFFLTALIFFMVLVSKIQVSAVVRSIKPLKWIIAFTFVIHLFSHEGASKFRLRL